MKKKLLIIPLIVIIGLIVFYIISNNGDDLEANYEIAIGKIDGYSPDRILTVYRNNREFKKYKEIRYTDDVYLCSSNNPTVYYGDLEDVDKVKVILNSGNYVFAKIIGGK